MQNTKLKTKKSVDRLSKIIKAGLEVFLEKGFEATSLNEVIEKSGGSLSTIYNYFDNKESFFKAVMDENSKIFRRKFEDKLKLNDSTDIREYLIKFGEIYLNIMFNPKIIKFYRLMLSDILRDNITPHGRIFLKNGLIGVNEILDDFFLKNIYKFKCKNHHKLGVFFCFMLREPYFCNAMFFGEKIDKTKQTEQIQEIVDLFLNGHLK